MATLKAELATAQQVQQEATDTRGASEATVRPLRGFIAENAVGMAGLGEGAGSEGLQCLRSPRGRGCRGGVWAEKGGGAETRMGRMVEVGFVEFGA